MYIGRFAPSPTGSLHAGSLVAALASWLDARAHGGRWLVRIEDVDTPRCSPAAHAEILRQLVRHHLIPDAEPWVQSHRGDAYQAALDRLVARKWVYPCACSRKDIMTRLIALGQAPQRGAELVYPGTCRPPAGLHGRPARAWRLHVAAVQQTRPDTPAVSLPATCWTDRRLGPQSQCVQTAVGDFVLRRADGLWAYQLAVVADDAAQGITDVVRGEDLADNTARQIVLQQALGFPRPRYLHTPLVLGANGEKLSKQNQAQPLPEGDVRQMLHNLQQAAQCLGLPPVPEGTALPDAQATWVQAWAARYNR